MKGHRVEASAGFFADQAAQMEFPSGDFRERDSTRSAAGYFGARFELTIAMGCQVSDPFWRVRCFRISSSVVEKVGPRVVGPSLDMVPGILRYLKERLWKVFGENSVPLIAPT